MHSGHPKMTGGENGEVREPKTIKKGPDEKAMLGMQQSTYLTGKAVIRLDNQLHPYVATCKIQAMAMAK